MPHVCLQPCCSCRLRARLAGLLQHDSPELAACTLQRATAGQGMQTPVLPHSPVKGSAPIQRQPEQYLLTGGNVHVCVCGADHADRAEEGRAVVLHAANHKRIPQRVEPAKMAPFSCTHVLKEHFLPSQGVKSTSRTGTFIASN